MFSNSSLKTKLIASFALASFFLLAVGGVALYSLSSVNREYSGVVNTDLPNVVSLSTIQSETKDLVIRSFRISQMEELKPDAVNVIVKLMDEAHANVDEAIKKYESLPFSAEEEALWKDTKLKMELVHKGAEKVAALAKSGKPEDLEAIRAEVREIPKNNIAFTESMNKLSNFVTKQAYGVAEHASNAADTAKVTTVAGILFGFIASMVLAFLLARYLSNVLTTVADKLSGGSTEVASASTEISSASTELSASATEQAAALQQTVASLEQVSAMVNKNADNAKRSQESAVAGQGAAQKGKDYVNQMIQSIQDISDSNTEIMKQIDESNKEIGEIVKVIAEIGNKTKVINDIVFQTKLLSFNASVEAARAGEHGKGFAVVAEEVGNLAQMSGNAAKEISTMLEGSIQKVESIVQNTKTRVERLVTEGKQKVDAGSATAQACGEVLNEIVAKVSEVNQMVGEIATASQEQAQGVQEINKAMTQLDQVTQQNAAAAEQASSAGETLMGQTTELEMMVAELKAVVTGAGNVSPVHRDAAAKVRKPAKREAAAKTDAQVIQMPAKDKAKKVSVSKKAVGQNTTPSENDPRFEEV